MAASVGPTPKLCQWACSTRYEDLPAEVRKETVTLLYDQVGGMIASATLPSCQPVVDMIRKVYPPGECSIVGHPVRTSVTNAALANGTIGHGDEVDATGQHGTGHYAATIVPAALTVGQYVGASGKQLCRAIAVGSEVTARAQSILGHYATRIQFEAAQLGGALGAAVSAGLLLGLDAERMEYALGLAASGTGGLACVHQEPLHQAKSLNHGRAAEAGVLSALLAREGYHGPKEVLAAENGFFDAFLGLPSAGHEAIDGLGENYLMREIAYKRFPVGGPNQTPLYAFLQLMKTHKFSTDDIEQIEVSLSRGAFQTVMTNKYPSVDLVNILSLAAVYGEVTFPNIHDLRCLENSRFKAFQGNARIFVMPRPQPATKAQRLEIVITVRTRKGEALRLDLRYPLMSEAEIHQKFRDLAGLRLNSERVVRLERKLMAIEAEQNVDALMLELELPY